MKGRRETPGNRCWRREPTGESQARGEPPAQRIEKPSRRRRQPRWAVREEESAGQTWGGKVGTLSSVPTLRDAQPPGLCEPTINFLPRVVIF